MEEFNLLRKEEEEEGDAAVEGAEPDQTDEPSDAADDEACSAAALPSPSPSPLLPLPLLPRGRYPERMFFVRDVATDCVYWAENTDSLFDADKGCCCCCCCC